ncbi:MAG TPA: hypothetical protein VFM70_04820 [Salinimicrobium sp.]|nr:hypothetical protein [Salinimicrobium sp.]
MKKLLFGFLLIAIFACEKDRPINSDLINFVPKSAGVIIKTSDFNSFREHLRANNFVQANLKFSFFDSLKTQFVFTDFLNFKKPVLLSFSPEGKGKTVISIITKMNQAEFLLADGLQVKDSISYDEHFIKELATDKEKFFFTEINGVSILSNSKLIVENVIRQRDFPVSEDLIHVYNSTSSKVSVLLNHKNAEEIFSNILPNNDFLSLEKIGSWTALDLDLSDGNLKANGITITKNEEPQIINIFKDLNALPNEIAKVTPLNATGFHAFTYNDFSILKKNLDHYHVNRDPAKIENENFFKLINEVGVISFEDEKVVFANSTGIIEASEILSTSAELGTTYREIEIYKLSNGDLFKKVFAPLVKVGSLQFYAILDHFIVFSQEQSALELIIANYQNETVLEKQEFYKNSLEGLSNESSILAVSLNQNFKEQFAGYVSSELKSEVEKLKFDAHPITALQIVYDSHFAHVHAVMTKNKIKSSSKGMVTQEASVRLENNLKSAPVLFTNHYTNQEEIVVQDEANNLYLISNSGEILWKKQLETPILGSVKEVDLYKNNKYQLAFSTPKKFYILDRNGKEVAPFPIEFKKEITQSLAIFDYDNNRNYRFVIVQGDDLVMYDANGKKVNGFEFKKAKAPITASPKHIRIGTKDYILFPDASGRLSILNRQGKIRVDVKEKIAFSDNEWFEHKKSFASTNAEGDLLLISEAGKIKKEKLGLAEFHAIDATPNNFVSISENHLHINDKKIELDYGIYTAPRIFVVKNKVYISVTDIQAHKVYIFNKNGELLPNFPVYGNSIIALGDFDSDKNLEFVVQGEENSLLFYEIN